MKIFNDPVHGFIEIPFPLLLKIIDHPYFQRLRYIKQLGLTYFVYPGAVHTRFNHCLGTLHLTQQAIKTLRLKSHVISDEEALATYVAVLLHDLGHTPFSHSLESIFISQPYTHETITKVLMHALLKIFPEIPDITLAIYEGRYEKRFLSQLVSSQLDMDRMDYLARDSFFTGVAEGVVGVDRLIKTMEVVGNQLVIEEKAIYSVEKFIVARRIMYWQVYLHKTALAAEEMLRLIFLRAKSILGALNFIDEALYKILQQSHQPWWENENMLQYYMRLNDDVLMYHLIQWQNEKDKVLSDLCKRLLNRKLFKLRFISAPIEEDLLLELRRQWAKRQNRSEEESNYYILQGKATNLAYATEHAPPIHILMKDGSLMPIDKASDTESISALAHPIEKYFILLPDQEWLAYYKRLAKVD